MTKRVEALVKPELLRWARRSAHLELAEAARKAQVKWEALASWENGESRPSVPQLRKLGNAYHRPIAVFYLPEPPTDFTTLRDFRRTSTSGLSEISPQLALQMRLAQSRREFLLELYQDLDEDLQEFTLAADLNEQPETVAQRLREYLNVSLSLQRSWQPHRDAMNGWRRAIEEAEIVVFQMAEVSEEEARGFSIYADTLPAIVVNVKDAPNGRSFTMLHELTHLALRQAGICDLREDSLDNANDDVEVFCNAVAGAALAPRSAILMDPVVQSKPTRSLWSDEEIENVSRSFRCSREVFVRRLLTLDRVSEPFYRAKREQYRQEYLETKRSTPTGPPDHARQVVSNLGKPYVRAALDAFNQELIHAGDLSELLGARLKHLNKIQRFAASA